MKNLDRQALVKLKEQGRLDKNDLLFYKILHDEPLTEAEELRLERYYYVTDLTRSFYSTAMIAKQLQTRYEISKPQAYRIIGEATQLFGLQSEVSREGIRALLTEGYLLLIRQGKEEKNGKLVKDCLDSLGKIHHLYTDFQDQIILDMPTIIISPDEFALRRELAEIEKVEESESEETT